MWDAHSDTFNAVNRENSDLFAWLGDAAYTDILMKYDQQGAQYVKERFRNTYDDGGYTALRNNKRTLITGVWDDHDYGENNAGIEFADKDRNRLIYLDFLDEPKESQRRLQLQTPLNIDYVFEIKDG